ncbi:ATP-binding protein [Metabacillus lacus]
MRIKQKFIYGVIGALAGILCMFYPIETLKDTNFDLRMVAVFVVTLYAGWLPGAVSLLIISAVRFAIGGEFYTIGIIVTCISFLIALLFRRFFLKSKMKLMFGTSIIAIYFIIYIVILYTNLDFLALDFYIVYFLAFYITYLSSILIIENLKKNNQQFAEMVYVDKLSTIGQMAASFAHEIRNPITTVRGFIQFLGKDTKDEKFKEFTPLILEELDRTNKIITSYLTLSKPNEQQLSKISIDKTLMDSIELMKPLGLYSRVELQYEGIDKNDVYGDEQHLKQALMNVIKNAIESIEYEGNVVITKKPDYFNEVVVLTIEDNGKGMTNEQLKNVGLPFYTTKTKGTGLGSMITNRLIREMQGTIQYDSKENRGTVVTITLKLYDKNEKKNHLKKG